MVEMSKNLHEFDKAEHLPSRSHRDLDVLLQPWFVCPPQETSRKRVVFRKEE